MLVNFTFGRNAPPFNFDNSSAPRRLLSSSTYQHGSSGLKAADLRIRQRKARAYVQITIANGFEHAKQTKKAPILELLKVLLTINIALVQQKTGLAQIVFKHIDTNLNSRQY